MLGDPGPGVNRPWDVRVVPEPLRWFTGQPRRADQGDAGRHMAVQILTQQLLVERAAGRLRHSGMGMGVDQAGQQPTLADQFGLRDGISGPAVAVGVEVNGLAVRQRTPSNPQDAHDWLSLQRDWLRSRRHLSSPTGVHSIPGVGVAHGRGRSLELLSLVPWFPSTSSGSPLPPQVPPSPGTGPDGGDRTTGARATGPAGAGAVRGSPPATPQALARHRPDHVGDPRPPRVWAVADAVGQAGRNRPGTARLRPRPPCRRRHRGRPPSPPLSGNPKLWPWRPTAGC